MGRVPALQVPAGGSVIQRRASRSVLGHTGEDSPAMGQHKWSGGSTGLGPGGQSLGSVAGAVGFGRCQEWAGAETVQSGVVADLRAQEKTWNSLNGSSLWTELCPVPTAARRTANPSILGIG